MKQRVTYIVTKPHDFRPEQVKVAESKDSLHINGVEAAKERRITLGLDELPSEISVALQKWHEIHVRWASPSHYISAPPFTSRVSPGLHVFFTPLDSTPEQALCEQLDSIVSTKLKCSSTNATSIKLPILSERFSMSTASEYYAYLPSISDTLISLRQRLCKKKDQTCLELFSDLSDATYLDIDYDTITRALVVTAGWPSLFYADDKKREVVKLREGDGTIEIGVLMHEPNPDPEDVQFGGFLTVLGQDATPKATRFQAPARHYPLLSASKDTSQPPTAHPLRFTTAFQHPTGLHPTLRLAFPTQHLTAPDPTCKLHAHLTLPSYLFIDKYQFSDALFLRSKNLQRLRSLAGATDLEAPDWVVDEWGSAALFELAHPTADERTAADEGWTVSIPMHLRYLPASNASHTRVPVPWPVVFWACRAEEGAKMAANPFDRVHLGYEVLFGPKTRFMHVQPAKTGELVEYINVPVLDLRKTGWVETGTVVTIVAAFVGLCWVLFGRLGPKEVTKGKKKE